VIFGFDLKIKFEHLPGTNTDTNDPSGMFLFTALRQKVKKTKM
jgi:hypothetical protein